MALALPSRPSLDWLRKTARQQLKELRVSRPDVKLSAVQLTLARDYGFSSWRSLKAHVEHVASVAADERAAPTDSDVAAFLRAIGAGDVDAVRSSLQTTPQLVNAIGPHPYWGGRPQALHVSIETARRDMFDLLLASGADVDGCNDTYENCSPLMLTVLWKRPDMQQALLRHGATISLVEALLLADDARVGKILRRGRSTLPRYAPNGGSILAMARTPFAIDRLLELGVSNDKKDRWGASPIEALSRLGPEGLPLVRHLAAKEIEATLFKAPRSLVTMNS